MEGRANGKLINRQNLRDNACGYLCTAASTEKTRATGNCPPNTETLISSGENIAPEDN